MKAVIPELPEKLKETKVNTALLHEVVIAVLANKRSGNACTKTISEVSGGGKKPWRQKGTGRARAGSNRSPIWRGGGVTFGPTREQSFKKRIPKKKKQIATVQMIVQRIKENNLKVVDKIEFKEPKTKLAVAFLKDIFNDNSIKTLVLLEERNPEILRLFRNIKNVTVTLWKDINAYRLLEHEKILFSQKAWDSFLSSRGLGEGGKLKVESGK